MFQYFKIKMFELYKGKKFRSAYTRGGRTAAREPRLFDSCCLCEQSWSVGVCKLGCGTLRFVASGRSHVRHIAFENDGLRK